MHSKAPSSNVTGVPDFGYSTLESGGVGQHSTSSWAWCHRCCAPRVRSASSKRRCCTCAVGWIITFYVALALFSLALFAFFGVSVYMTTHSLPDRTSTVHVAGMTAPVVISREPSGMLHIQAQSEHDMFFAQGYTAMQVA